MNRTIPRPLQRAALHDIGERQQELLNLTHRGPVALIEQEQIAGILLSPAQWQAIINTLEAARECLASLDAVQSLPATSLPDSNG
jgi:hypothetical protein